MFARPVSTSSLARPDFDRFLDYSRRFFDRGQYTNNGPLVRLLEQRLAEFHETSHCVAFCSGFWALVLAIDAMRIHGRDEVVLPSLTYRRMADVIAWVGLKPRFCEVSPRTLAMTAESVDASLGEQTALVMGVHPIVNTCEAGKIAELCERRGVPLLFDSVESVYESTADGRVGSIARAEVFSLHASKLVNGGEGGYLTTNDGLLADHLRLVRGFGFQGRDTIAVAGGTNAKLNEMHAAMALANLDELNGLVDHNLAIYRTYQRLLPKVHGLRLVAFDERHRTSFKNIVVELEDEWPVPRATLLRLLEAEGILARAYYSPPLHRKSMQYPHVPADLPLTDLLAQRHLTLPCGYMVDTGDVRRVIDLLGFVADHAAALGERIESTGISHV